MKWYHDINENEKTSRIVELCVMNEKKLFDALIAPI